MQHREEDFFVIYKPKPERFTKTMKASAIYIIHFKTDAKGNLSLDYTERTFSDAGTS